ncbi:MAG: nucleotidyltransferase family protein [Zoogloeaceae bacterium]|nr:nucleotidyltransferase family protein [Zoogloeaceae bacterium]
MTTGPVLDEPLRHLFRILRDVSHVEKMRLADWNGVLVLARQARLLGSIASRILARQDLADHIPERVRGHLMASINYSAHRLQMVRMELAVLSDALPAEVPVTLLKGAAYIVEGLPLAQGRMPNDVDLLVPRAHLGIAEAALRDGGWEMENVDEYDQQYYRQWSHELPPMRIPGHALEVDLHHTIAPVTSRVRANDTALFSALVPVEGTRFSVLSRHDQIIHAAIHLFQDSELVGKLRDLVDIDALYRSSILDQQACDRFWKRAAQHGATTPLWYALNYSRSWLGTPVPADPPGIEPSWLARAMTGWLFRHVCPPRIFERGKTPSRVLVELAAQARYHWLRMPPALLVRHLGHKSMTAVRSIIR